MIGTKIRAGRDVVLSFGPLTDAAGNFVDMSGSASASWWCGKSAYATGADVFVTKTSAAGGISLSSSTVNGITSWTANVILAPADTADKPPTPPAAPYYHELEIKDANGKDYTVELVDNGNIILLPSLIPPL